MFDLLFIGIWSTDMMQQTYSNAGVQTQKKVEGWKSIKWGLKLLGIGVVLLCVSIFVGLAGMIPRAYEVWLVMGGYGALAMLLFGGWYILIGLSRLYRKLYVGIGIQAMCAFTILLLFIVQRLVRFFLPNISDVIVLLTNSVMIVLFCMTLPAMVFIIQDVVGMFKKKRAL